MDWQKVAKLIISVVQMVKAHTICMQTVKCLILLVERAPAKFTKIVSQKNFLPYGI